MKTLFFTGFEYIAFLTAVLFSMVRLLPPDHPYLSPVNFGRYGVRHVIAQAANNLEFKKRNIDQIVVFGLVMAGIVILIAQVALLIFALLASPALAAMPNNGLFLPPYPDQDLSYYMLDLVFGVPDVFAMTAGQQTAFHSAFHGLLEFYSMAMFVVAMLLFLYYIVVVVLETAESGTPFGQRFDSIWAPIRLVVAIGLLLPLANGLNSAQYITLYAAKYGSGFATNGWIKFNQSMTNPFGLDDVAYIVKPLFRQESLLPLIKYIAISRTCAEAYQLAKEYVPGSNGQVGPRPLDIQPYVIGKGSMASLFTAPADTRTWVERNMPNWMGGKDAPPTPSVASMATSSAGLTGLQQALAESRNSSITVVFGEKDAVRHSEHPGDVYPFCGKISYSVGSMRRPGAFVVQEEYFSLIQKIWDDPNVVLLAQHYSSLFFAGKVSGVTAVSPAAPPDKRVFESIKTNYAGNMTAAIGRGIDILVRDTLFNMPEELAKMGWAGSGIWYNRIAELNGAFMDAATNPPDVAALPMLMQKVLDRKNEANQAVSGVEAFAPSIGGRPIPGIDGNDHLIAMAMSEAYKYFDDPAAMISNKIRPTGNMIIDGINWLFGTTGIFDLRYNRDINPLAQLVGVGKGLVDSSVSHLMMGSLATMAGSMFEGSLIGKAGKYVGGILTGLTVVGLSVGLVLFYIIPFMPFIYVFFGLSSWVKTIFEAMVGVPLWALAHLQISGTGLPADKASKGYFLIFEIFLRPILIVFGLISSTIIFTASVYGLQEIFQMVVDNVTGAPLHNLDGLAALTGGNDIWKGAIDAVDEFFYTVIYAIIVYILAVSSFKLIDDIPNGLIRYMGADVQSFSDGREDPVAGLNQYAAIAGATYGGQFAGQINKFAGTSGGMLNDVLSPKGRDDLKSGLGWMVSKVKGLGGP